MSRAPLWGVAAMTTVAVSLALSPKLVSALPSKHDAIRSPPATTSSTRCGVPSSEATFEAPGVQVYYKQLEYNKKTGRPRRQLIACALPTYTKQVIGTINEFSR